MPELPDVSVYVEAIERFVAGRVLEGVRIGGPSLLRSVEPPLSAVAGHRVTGAHRLGKRVVIALDPDLFLIFHLMIAGRFHWKRPRAKLARKTGLAALDFAHGTLLLTEAGTKRRASLYVVQGEAQLAEHDPGGLEVLGADLESFRERILAGNHTLKRALTDPHLLSGIGNAYSDEILHRARLSPVKLTGRLGEEEITRLFDATLATLTTWLECLRDEAGDGFPENVTAFREGMTVHGRYRQPCPDCGSPVQRIVYASNETNYCATCQTGGRLLADRALSRLLKKDWPRSLEELEARRSA
ncbi:MAG: formamidopyrimidine-DNA glycosylase [Deltaproteobacteria bacterium]|nr:formamidopyrimidine-DNA glycosylase [Deltaproteobacteria bacterium]MBW2362341.1 formamidopyrimidine-DNA glycosylase [Deltaproteobacteria bacterium]